MRAARRRHRHGLPGADDGAEPGQDHRRAGRRGHPLAHRRGRAEAEDRARRILDRVGLPEAKFPLSRYPHELSGGQRQRVVIAIACALKPKLLIADEPTTALDVVLQKQILDLLRDLVHENRMGLLLICHDLAVVTDMADRVTIMRDGEVMEDRRDGAVLSEQVHPYTRQLAQASMHVPARRPAAPPGPAAAPARGDRRRARIPGPARLAAAQGHADARRRRRLLHHRIRASRRRWSAAPAAASPRWPAWCWRSTGRPPARSISAARRFQAVARRRCARPGATCRWCSRTPTARSTRATASSAWWPSRCTCSTAGSARANAARWSPQHSTRSACRRATWTSTRTNSPAASASASRSPAPSSPGRSWSSPTSRCRRSTSRSAPRSSTCSPT